MEKEGALTGASGATEVAAASTRGPRRARLGRRRVPDGVAAKGARRPHVDDVDVGDDAEDVGEDAGKGRRRTLRPSRLRGLATKGAARVDDDDDRRAADIAHRRRRPHKHLANEKGGVRRLERDQHQRTERKGLRKTAATATARTATCTTAKHRHGLLL
jgi:hypothetical protein